MNTKNTKNTRGKSQEKHSKQVQSHIHYAHIHTRSTRVQEQQRERGYMVEFIPNPMGRWGLESTRDLP
jgi:hypothetical protein